METIQIRMLGEFSLQAGSARISDSDNRTRKVWLLLSYLICHRSHPVSQKKLIELLWGDEPASASPENALRITFHRARTLLNQLWPEAGHTLLQRREGGYIWNEEIPITVDCDRFEELCVAAAAREDRRLEYALEAISLYNGDFLEKQSAESWVIPLCTHFHNLYISMVLQASEILSARGRHPEAVELCRKAGTGEPYLEPLYQAMIRSLAAMGDLKGAETVYTELCRRLFNDFGIRPSEQTRQIYRQWVHTPADMALPIDQVLEQLTEENVIPGAMRCDYDYFKVLCHAESRSMERTGKATHILLLSVSGEDGRSLPRRTLNRVMEQLGEQIRTNLRRGDVYSQCSICQYIVMLPNANYENSCMVCRRILGAYSRRHPHVSAKFHFLVQPLTPTVCVP